MRKRHSSRSKSGPPKVVKFDLPKKSRWKNWFYRILAFTVAVAVIYTLRALLKDQRLDHDDQAMHWWKTDVIYQVYPRSLQDSNGDGVGDLKGITSRLDYFVDLGIGALWLSPIFTSPMVDFGYDISDFKDIDPIFGDMKDFEQLVNVSHSKGIKIILDLVPNHSSNLHPWFIESCKSRENRFSDYYIWRDGERDENGTITPPNNWISVFGGPMWTWNDQRQQYYFHQFTKEQPDLNYDNISVRNEMLDVFKFWLQKGVDGFRLDAVRHMFENPKLPDENPSNLANALPNEYDFNEHLYNIDQPRTHELIKSWRLYLNDYKYRTGKHIFLMAEVFELNGASPVMPYYHSGADFPFNFNLQAINQSCDAICIHGLVDDWLGQMPHGKWPNWVIGSHDTPRISTKVGTSLLIPLNMLLLTLPGTAITYYGEEIGMQDVSIPFEQTQDPAGLNVGPQRYSLFSRDPCRTPMQWSDDYQAGFTKSNQTWLPLHEKYKENNVKAQLKNPSRNSTLQIYKQLIKLRSQPPFQQGDLDYSVVTKDIFSYFRFTDGHPAYLIAMNVGDRPVTENYRRYDGRLQDSAGKFVAKNGEIVLSSKAMESKVVSLDRLSLHPKQAVIVKFWPEK